MNPWLLVTAFAVAVGIIAGMDDAPPPPAAHPTSAEAPLPLFQTSDRCIACHKGVRTSDGIDVSIGYDWRASMMANSARDPYWQAAVRREIIDHPRSAAAIEAKCSRCHMPMASVVAATEGRDGSVFANLPVTNALTGEARLAADGVSCAACHQIAPDGLGDEVSFSGGFVVDAQPIAAGRPVYGPFEPDAAIAGIMHSATGLRPIEGEHVRSSELCASCHTLLTHAIRPDGSSGPEFPEQSPYLEWLASSAARAGTSCQDCHMPEVGEDVPVTRVLGKPRSEVSRHVFRGGNFFMLRLLNRYRDELGVSALPDELVLAAERTEEHLRTATAAVDIIELERDSAALTAAVEVRNQAGHKFPTAYPSRRAWLQFTVADAEGRTVFESGGFTQDGRVAGDDHDEDGSTYEPHYEQITSPDQVQVYQAVMVDGAGDVTTGLMSAERWVKDNRLLPEGFDASSADPRVATIGKAESDLNFVSGSDQIEYAVEVGADAGPLMVSVHLWFQPIGYRWAENLGAYDALETNRFMRYYREMAAESAIVLAVDSQEIR